MSEEIDLNAEIEKRRAAMEIRIVALHATIDECRDEVKRLRGQLAALPRPPIKRVRKAAAK